MSETMTKASPELMAALNAKHGPAIQKLLALTKEPESVAQGTPPAIEAPKPKYRSAGDLIDEYPELRPVLIDGLLRQRETMNLVAASKKGKTYLLIYICLCVATGRHVFGIYPVKRAKVLMIDNELHRETITHRIREVARAMGLMREDYADWLFVDCLRGEVCDLFQMEAYFKKINPAEFGLITLDAWYRMIPAKESENDNAVVTRMLNFLDAQAERIGAAFLIIHHASKGDQSGKSVTDMGSGAGAQSRAVDTHAVLRQHEEDNVAVFDAAVRSFRPVDPFCLEWSFPLWNYREDLDPTQLKKPSGRTKTATKDPKPVEPKEPEWTPPSFVAKYCSDEPKQKKVVLAYAMTDGLKLAEIERLITVATAEGILHSFTKEKGGAIYLSTRRPELMDVSLVPPSPPRAHPPTPPCGRQATQGAGVSPGAGGMPDPNPGQPKRRRTRGRKEAA